MPDGRLRNLEREYARVRRTLPQDNGEVKGKNLSEDDLVRLMPMLRHHDAVLEVIGIDLGLHTEQGILANQQKRADAMTALLTDEFSPSFVESVWKARRELEGFSPQLNIQSAMIFEFIPTVLEHATLYFSQRRPAELGTFNWVVDAKGFSETPTPWERWWSSIIKPAIQTKLAYDPIKSIKCGDYSHMKRFHMKTLSEFHKTLLEPKPNGPPPLDLGMVLTESLRFSYAPEPGLELVDILVNATRRALCGRLQKKGWQEIPTLIINRNPQNIPLVSLDVSVPTSARLPYHHVVKGFAIGNRSMLTAANRRAGW